MCLSVCLPLCWWGLGQCICMIQCRDRPTCVCLSVCLCVGGVWDNACGLVTAWIHVSVGVGTMHLHDSVQG